jgi:hypothetical protein
MVSQENPFNENDMPAAVISPVKYNDTWTLIPFIPFPFLDAIISSQFIV